MAEMTPEEWRAFLREPVRPAMLATVRPDGRPHLAPIWIVVDDDDTVIFTTGAGTAKGRAIQRDPRVALCVDDDQPPFSYVLVEGTAAVSTDLDEMLVWATRLGGRYMGEEHAEAFGRRNAVEGELLVRVTPTKVVARKNISD
jgi:PPOX class probable F420-dependent enzyme